jgi:hypothetical protein
MRVMPTVRIFCLPSAPDAAGEFDTSFDPAIENGYAVASTDSYHCTLGAGSRPRQSTNY